MTDTPDFQPSALVLPPSSVPTASDIYYKLGGLEGKLDAHLAAVATSQANHTKRLDDHDNRLDAIELSGAKMTGILAIGTPILAVIVAVVTNFVSKLIP
jgi:hypothetical protein